MFARVAAAWQASQTTLGVIGLSAGHLRIRDVVEQVPPLQGLHEEEPECRDVKLHRPRLEFAVAQQVGLILAEVSLIELVGRAVKMLREPLDGLDVILNSGLA
jgi:hypothetical protein